MKTLLIAAACIPLLAACKKDAPTPETTAPAVEVPAATTTTTEPPAAALPPATESTEPTAVTATAPVNAPTPAPTAGTESSGASVAGAMDASGGGTYVVDKGETLWSIAQKNGIAHGDLAKWNNIDDPRDLRAGQKLMLSAP